MADRIRARVDGWGITVPTERHAVAGILEAARQGRSTTVFTLNLDHLVKLRTNAGFREAYRSADMVTADGAPVAWLARWQDRSVRRTTGADLLLPIAATAADAGIPIFLFGTSPAVIARASEALREATGQRVEIAGQLSPSAAFDPTGQEADAAIAAIARSGARICIVALGAPKQEIFAHRAKSRGLACVMICSGASLDFIAGEQIRSPRFLQKLGAEWLWRLALNPRRLAKRYIQCALLFADLVFNAPLRGGAYEERS